MPALRRHQPKPSSPASSWTRPKRSARSAGSGGTSRGSGARRSARSRISAQPVRGFSSSQARTGALVLARPRRELVVRRRPAAARRARTGALHAEHRLRGLAPRARARRVTEHEAEPAAPARLRTSIHSSDIPRLRYGPSASPSLRGSLAPVMPARRRVDDDQLRARPVAVGDLHRRGRARAGPRSRRRRCRGSTVEHVGLPLVVDARRRDRLARVHAEVDDVQEREQRRS